MRNANLPLGTKNARDHYREMTDEQKRALVEMMETQWATGHCRNAIKKNCWAPPLCSLREEKNNG